MITEQQKYTAGILRNIGFALLAPLGSVVFQWVVFKKSLFSGNFLHAVILFVTSWVFILGGYTTLQENRK